MDYVIFFIIESLSIYAATFDTAVQHYLETHQVTPHSLNQLIEILNYSARYNLPKLIAQQQVDYTANAAAAPTHPMQTRGRGPVQTINGMDFSCHSHGRNPTHNSENCRISQRHPEHDVKMKNTRIGLWSRDRQRRYEARRNEKA